MLETKSGGLLWTVSGSLLTRQPLPKIELYPIRLSYHITLALRLAQYILVYR